MITIKLEGFDQAMKSLAPGKVKTAARLALNEAARAARTEGSKQIRAKWNVQAAKVNKELRNIRMATTSDLTAIIQGEGRPISLTYFGAKEIRNFRGQVRVMDRNISILKKRVRMKQGVHVKILRGRATHLEHAFIATMKSGHIGVFRRLGKRRLKIADMSTITIGSMFFQVRVIEAVTKVAQSRWSQRFAHHLDRLQR